MGRRGGEWCTYQREERGEDDEEDKVHGRAGVAEGVLALVPEGGEGGEGSRDLCRGLANVHEQRPPFQGDGHKGREDRLADVVEIDDAEHGVGVRVGLVPGE